ncbi:MAG TPA: hypothetical protein VGS19_06010, partial [Streptosporangiaceae bacterium]|nr:hypothetical protein [Streptosporangiaceae bacterium]
SARYPCPHVLLLADWDTKPALSQQEDASLTDHPGRTTRLPRRVYYYGTEAEQQSGSVVRIVPRVAGSPP